MRRRHLRGITVGLSLLLMGLGMFRGQVRAADPPTTPMLRLETGMHTATIWRIGMDAEQRYLVTGSEDKTIRVWELASGRLLRTLRPPLGTGNEGKIYAVAFSPDGNTIAAAGRTGWENANSIYLFDRASGQLRQQLTGLSEVILHLVYSRDGAFLAATLVKNGLRVYRTADVAEVERDAAYGDRSNGADFDASGRLITTSYDGKVRLYDRQAFRLLATHQTPGGKQPYGVAFSPDGRRVAVGYADTSRVDVLAGDDLRPLYAPDTTGVTGILSSVTWAADGQALYAGGQYSVQGSRPIRRWATGGQGAATDLPAAQDTLFHLLPLAGGGVVFGAGDPAWGVLDARGQRQSSAGPPIADFRNNWEGFLLAPDGATVQFGYEPFGKSPARFAVRDRALTLTPQPDSALTAPRTTTPGLTITDWQNTTAPQLNGTALKLQPYETSFSLALAPDGQRFLLGTGWYLRLFDRQGKQQWEVPVPDVTWSVNIAPDGQVAVAAFGDGTIRWYRLHDSQELLAFFPHHDQKRWVLWTPSGYYDASPGADELIGWHVNRGREHKADFFPVSQFRSTYYRPDVVARVLDTLDAAEALRQANTEANRRQETLRIEQRLPPVVDIVTPQDGTTVSTSPVTVRVRVRASADAPVLTLKALVDGRPADQPRRVNLTAPSSDATLHELTVPLPARDCEVTILAENRHATSTPATVRLRWQGVQEAFVIQPKLYVLAIGISRYQRTDLALNFAAKDATDFVQTLRSQRGKLYQDVQAKLFTDTDATRDNILQGLEWLERQTTSKDVAVLFLAGHGINDPNGLYYFLPVAADPTSLKSTGVAATEVKNTVRALSGKVLVFLDTCHSGALLGSKRRTAQDLTGIINELISVDSGAVLFAASTGQQYSLENDKWSNGAFTKAVVEGLSGKADYNKNGRITVNMLELYVAERVKELTGGQQTPTTAKPSGVVDFPLVVLR